MTTLRNLLEEDVKKSIANGQDLTLPENRTIFLKKFIEDHEKNDLVSNDIKSIRPTADRVFNQELGEKNIQKIKSGNKKTKYNSKLAKEIAATTTEKKSGIKDEKKDDSKNQTKTDETKTDETKKQFQVREPIYNHWDAMGIGALFQATMMPLRAAWPEMEGLTEQEQKALGEMFLPGFQRYGDEKLQYLVLPSLGAIGILAPKIIKGRKLHKEAEQRKKKDAQNNKLTEEEEARINKLTCKFCNEMFDSAHIKGHESTCKKRIKPQ